MKHPYEAYVNHLADCVREAGKLPLGGFAPCASAPAGENAPTVMLFSPHPDDECITGLLPLRLMREVGCRIVNVPVTHGSNPERQAERHEELVNACGFLGWDLVRRETDSTGANLQPWEKNDIVDVLHSSQPAALLMPHVADWNARHIATHHLVMDALAEMDSTFSCAVIETEFWGAMTDPNLMVEADTTLVADLVAATSFHVKEVERNPYHRLLPAWMLDNVRRGGELVGGAGQAAPDFLFATLYRLRRWENGSIQTGARAGRMLSLQNNVKEVFNGNHHSR